jgi:hypothetical protein
MTTTLTAEPTTTPEVTATAAVAPAVAPTPILGLLGLASALSGIAFGLVIPLSIVAIVLGWLALKREPANRTLAIWTIVLGAIPGALIALAGVLAVAFIVPIGLFAAFAG